jgi:hypothetical protein
VRCTRARRKKSGSPGVTDGEQAKPVVEAGGRAEFDENGADCDQVGFMPVSCFAMMRRWI